MLALGVITLAGLASFFDRGLRRTRRPEAVCGIAPLAVMGAMAAAKGLAGLFGARGKDKAAKAQAANQNAANQWKYNLDKQTYSTEKTPMLKKAQRSGALRKQLQAAIMSNPKYGLAALLPGFQKLETSYNPGAIVNPYEAAGAPPKVTAATGGLGGMIGSALGGAAEGAASGMGMAGDMKTLGWLDKAPKVGG